MFIKIINSRKLRRFLVSGVSAAASEYLTFNLLLTFMGVAISNVISFSIGMIISFSLNKTWVFKSSGAVKKEITHYIMLALFNLMIGTAIVYALAFIIPAFVAKVVVMATIASWNYLFFMKRIFKTS